LVEKRAGLAVEAMSRKYRFGMWPEPEGNGGSAAGFGEALRFMPVNHRRHRTAVAATRPAGGMRLDGCIDPVGKFEQSLAFRTDACVHLQDSPGVAGDAVGRHPRVAVDDGGVFGGDFLYIRLDERRLTRVR
jgi:hypothetical protein